MRFTEKEKEEILLKIKEGRDSFSIEREYGISNNTIRMWKYRLNHPELNSERKRGQYKRPVTLEDYKERYEILKKYQAFLKAQREKK